MINFKYNSYDIFDTCFVRVCGEPVYVFEKLAFSILNSNIITPKILDFIQIRKNGEAKARDLTSKRDDITIEDIYKQCDFHELTDVPKSEIMKKEIEIELSILVPVHNIKCEIERLRATGKMIYFISDMYLPYRSVIRLLQMNGLWKPVDRLYLSGEIGLSKSSGRLFRYIKSDIKNNHLFSIKHSGDNFHSDILRAFLNGFFPRYIRNDYSFYQKMRRNNSIDSVNLYEHQIAGISRAICLSRPNDVKVKFAADLIAPLFVPFVYSILEDAKRNDIKNLFFLSRDGYILFRIAQHFSRYFPDIKMNYIYVSRKSLYLPGLEKVSKHKIEAFLNKSKRVRLEEVIDRLLIDKVELGDSRITKYISLKGEELIEALLTDSYVIGLIEKKWRAQSKYCLQYFEQTRLASYANDNAIVDLRGSRRSHQSINSILSRNGYNKVSAYYLEVTEDRVPPKKNEEYTSYFFRERVGLNSKTKYAVYAYDLLEQYFAITPFQRTAYYSKKHSTNDILPVFDEIRNNKFTSFAQECLDINESVCFKFADLFIELKLQNDAVSILRSSYFILSSFMKNPRKEYLEVLDGLKVSDTKHIERNYITKISIRNLFSLQQIGWLEGAFKYSFGNVGLFFFNSFYKVFKLKRKISRLLKHLYR